MFLLIIITSVTILFAKYGYNYCKGITEYIYFNNRPHDKEKENSLDTIIDELIELCEAIYQFDIIEIILELSDVIHAIIKYIFINYLPINIFCCWICWIPVFFLVLPCTIKLGNRFKNNQCIRNHNNLNNCNHKCNYEYHYNKKPHPNIK